MVRHRLVQETQSVEKLDWENLWAVMPDQAHQGLATGSKSHFVAAVVVDEERLRNYRPVDFVAGIDWELVERAGPQAQAVFAGNCHQGNQSVAAVRNQVGQESQFAEAVETPEDAADLESQSVVEGPNLEQNPAETAGFVADFAVETEDSVGIVG